MTDLYITPTGRINTNNIPWHLGCEIHSNPNAYTLGKRPDTSRSRSPGRALRRHHAGKHTLPVERIPAVFMAEDMIIVHPTIYTQLLTDIDTQARNNLNDISEKILTDFSKLEERIMAQLLAIEAANTVSKATTAADIKKAVKDAIFDSYAFSPTKLEHGYAARPIRDLLFTDTLRYRK